MGVRVRGIVILLAVLLVGCLSLEIPKDGEKHDAKRAGCGEDQCSADVVTSPKPTQPGYAGIVDDDDDASTRPPVPALKIQPTLEELEAAHKRLEERLHEDEHPEEPEKHVLERWGFFETPTFGKLDRKRDKEYAEGISAFEEMIKGDKKLTKRQKDDINGELEKFLQDDHNYQVWSAHVYKQEMHKRKKRGIPEKDIYSYEDMPNPYYQKKK